VTVVANVTGFDGGDVLLADGSRRPADVVIAATGYRQGLEELVGHLGVLQADGRPVVRGAATAPQAPHLRFLGFTTPISGVLREIGIDARAIAEAISRGE
jgi:putative flavoprotein involved in K+ transport